MDNRPLSARDLNLLEEISQNPDTTQAHLAVKLGVAVGTVNWHLKRLIDKGYVKVKRAERRKLRYIVTPSGVALRAKLTKAYIEQSMSLYREIRKKSLQAAKEARNQGYTTIQIVGDGDVAEVCRLTFLEQGLEVVDTKTDDQVGVLTVHGQEMRVS
jgi:DNA-binding MarR family transcriptional regulator